jgi:hypothetical protein
MEKPDEWKWSSFRTYVSGEEGLVKGNCQEWPLRITYSVPDPLIRNPRMSGAPGTRHRTTARNRQSAESFLLQAHLSGDVVAKLLLDLLLGLGIEVG